jgi:FYVE/RhoGEF/PH domain-containing protein 5/6
LHTHAQTLALLALQRNTANLPFQLITPGRNLVKRGALLQLEGAADPKERELLLFSDCLLWLAAADGLDGQLAEKWDWSATRPAPPPPAPEPEAAPTLAPPTRPRMARQRSKSDAALPTLSTRAAAQASRASEGGQALAPSPKRSVFPKAKRRARAAGGGAEERWVFKGRAELIDIEVTAASRDAGDERRFEVLSPEASFAVYASRSRALLRAGRGC